jgi:hypothetical protein
VGNHHVFALVLALQFSLQSPICFVVQGTLSLQAILFPHSLEPKGNGLLQRFYRTLFTVPLTSTLLEFGMQMVRDPDGYVHN